MDNLQNLHHNKFPLHGIIIKQFNITNTNMFSLYATTVVLLSLKILYKELKEVTLDYHMTRAMNNFHKNMINFNLTNDIHEMTYGIQKIKFDKYKFYSCCEDQIKAHIKISSQILVTENFKGYTQTLTYSIKANTRLKL